jgi:hypothetical protein
MRYNIADMTVQMAGGPLSQFRAISSDFQVTTSFKSSIFQDSFNSPDFLTIVPFYCMLLDSISKNGFDFLITIPFKFMFVVSFLSSAHIFKFTTL